MGFFSSSSSATKCKECGLEISDPERLKRHQEKAHNKKKEKCHIENSKVSLSYDLMKKTGNTGAVSSLQFLNECINKKCLSKNSFGCFVDYGWEGVNLFLFKKV